jgi:hypothetical protein
VFTRCARFGDVLRVHVKKSVGKPDAQDGHVRFDERGTETGLMSLRAQHPRRSSTLPTALTGFPARTIQYNPSPPICIKLLYYFPNRRGHGAVPW